MWRAENRAAAAKLAAAAAAAPLPDSSQPKVLLTVVTADAIHPDPSLNPNPPAGAAAVAIKGAHEQAGAEARSARSARSPASTGRAPPHWLPPSFRQVRPRTAKCGCLDERFRPPELQCRARACATIHT